jgi:hypothetical protein
MPPHLIFSYARRETREKEAQGESGGEGAFLSRGEVKKRLSNKPI